MLLLFTVFVFLGRLSPSLRKPVADRRKESKLGLWRWWSGLWQIVRSRGGAWGRWHESRSRHRSTLNILSFQATISTGGLKVSERWDTTRSCMSIAHTAFMEPALSNFICTRFRSLQVRRTLALIPHESICSIRSLARGQTPRLACTLSFAFLIRGNFLQIEVRIV
ncbi:hypothetical protein ABW19_dt0206588 [Dactylella cylindrospora]|nr:hypothetical protein ABW19_dt0206588 [Dactylella cylindrospora]